MNTTQIKKVMKKYKDAWEKQDSNLILECFTKNGDSWMGKKFRVLPNGNNVFYNKINK